MAHQRGQPFAIRRMAALAMKWRVKLPMGRPQTFTREADARAYADANGGIVESTGKPKPEPGAPKTTDDVPPEIRAALRRRSGGRCEIGLDGCSGTANHAHHRLKRRSGVHTLENLVHSCWNCHTASPAALHRNIAWSLEVGLLLNSWENPPSEPWDRSRLAE